MDLRNNIITLGTDYLKRRGIENPGQEATRLYEHVFGKTDKITFKATDDKEKLDEIARIASIKNTKRYNELLNRRVNGEPLQYLLSEWEFYGYPMKVGEGVLIPRPETEFLIDIGRDFAKNKGEIFIIDLCAGSACVGVAMAKQTEARGAAVELSENACKYARENIKLNGVTDKITLHTGDIFDESLIEKLPPADCIFANPPYLSAEDMKNLQREVTFEPEIALYGGKDGLDYYKKIFPMWKKKLKEGGIFAVEVGDGQSKAVLEIMKTNGIDTAVQKDYAGIDRILYSKFKRQEDNQEKLKSLIKERDMLLENANPTENEV